MDEKKRRRGERERERMDRWRELKQSDLTGAWGSRLRRGCCEDRSEYIKQQHVGM